MKHAEYFRVQAENLLKDVQGNAQKLFPFDVDSVLVDYDYDEEDFSLVEAQHIVSLMAGFDTWESLLSASESAQELGRLLFDNHTSVFVEDWHMYLAGVERDFAGKGVELDDDSRLEIFKRTLLDLPAPDTVH